MKSANTILHDFCTNCVKTEEHAWLRNEASVVNQVVRICEHADTRREMETLAAADLQSVGSMCDPKKFLSNLRVA